MKGRQLFDGEPTTDDARPGRRGGDTARAGAKGTASRRQRNLRGVQERARPIVGPDRGSARRRAPSHRQQCLEKTHFIWWGKVRHAVEDEGHSRSERGRRRKVRPRRRSSRLETEEEGILHTRPAKVKMQGLRWRLRVRPREEKEAMQGVRRRGDMPTQSSAFTVQGLRRRFDLCAPSSAYDVQGMRRRAHLPARQGEVEMQRVRRNIVVLAR